MKNKKPIRTLAELRAEKMKIKRKIRDDDEKAKNGFLYNIFEKLTSKVEDSTIVQQTPIGSGVYGALNFLSTKAQDKFRLGNTGKAVISIAAVVLAPVIAKKIQHFIEDKF
jgi:hypothetical protein